MSNEGVSKLDRRALIGSAAGGLAALAVGSLVRPDGARAANGQPVLLGTFNDATAETSIRRNPGNVTNVTMGGPDYGLAANSHVAGGMGMQGATSAMNGVGVIGRTAGHHSQVAVDAIANTGLGEGYAVRARTLNGVAVYASATGGAALQVEGRAIFKRSGKVSFSAGQSSRTISGHRIEADSVVVATIQGNVAGTWVRGVSLSPSVDTFTIRLNKAAPSTLSVGFFIVN